MFKEMPTNDLFQVQILASSVWEPPKRKTDTCPGYEVMASHYVELPPDKVTNVNLGMSFSPPSGTSIIILPATGSLSSKWSLSGKCLKSNSTGEALVAVKNNSRDTTFIASGDILGQVVLLPGKSHKRLQALLPDDVQEGADGSETAIAGDNEENVSVSEQALCTQLITKNEDHVVQQDPAATKVDDSLRDAAEERNVDDKRAGLSVALQTAQDTALCNLKDATLIVFDEETQAKGRRRSVKINGIRVTGRGRETDNNVSHLLFDPIKDSRHGWMFLIPPTGLKGNQEHESNHRESDSETVAKAKTRWNTAVRVYSIAHAVAVSKLVWHQLYQRAEDILKERSGLAAQEEADQHVSIWKNGVVDEHWLLHLGTVYLSAYSQYFSEKGVKPSISELTKYTDLVVVDKRQTRGCRDESLFVSGTNIIGCSISKALKLNAAATRRFESSVDKVGQRVMTQRWVRHGEGDDGLKNTTGTM